MKAKPTLAAFQKPLLTGAAFKATKLNSGDDKAAFGNQLLALIAEDFPSRQQPRNCQWRHRLRCMLVPSSHGEGPLEKTRAGPNPFAPPMCAFLVTDDQPAEHLVASGIVQPVTGISSSW